MSDWFGKLVGEIAACVDVATLLFGSDDPLTAEDIILKRLGGKTRRVDADFKRAVLAAALGQHRGRTPQGLVRARGQGAESSVAYWVAASMARLNVAQRLAFKDPAAIGLAFDAGRVGQPKADSLVIAACLPASGLGTWLPLQALS